jgi:folate-binding protein YgfZ
MPDSPLAAVTAAAGAVPRDFAGWAMPASYGDPSAGYDAAVSAAALFDVSHRGKLELTGPDAPSFLHNLCTNDVTGLPLGAGCEAFFTTAKAKVVGHALVYHVRLDGGRDALMLDTEPGKAEALLKHLDRYLISEQVELADRTAEYAQMHLAGPRAKATLERALGDEVPDLDELQHMERTFGLNATCHVRRHDPLGVPGYDIVCRRERAEGVWRMLTAAGARPAGLDTYEVLRVEAGTPVDGRDFDENRFVVEVGRGPRAISYAKGCYLGQEPIVMARDRAGHVNRTLLGLALTDGGRPAPAGAKVFRGDAEVGVVSSSVASPRAGGPVALAYLRRGHQDPGTEVTVETPDGRRPAVVRALPIVG